MDCTGCRFKYDSASPFKRSTGQHLLCLKRPYTRVIEGVEATDFKRCADVEHCSWFEQEQPAEKKLKNPHFSPDIQAT